MRSVITYETHHGSAKRLATAIASRLKCLCINVDTPFQAEDETEYDALILVFGFRGPYTAQLTKLFIRRMQGKLNYKHLIVVGEGIFSEKEFPSVAADLKDMATPFTFHSYFMQGQLRIATLTQEERALLDKFSELTGIKITNMGEFSPKKAYDIADEIAELLDGIDVPEESKERKTRWICTVCGYVHTGDAPPDNCPQCGKPASVFKNL